MKCIIIFSIFLLTLLQLTKAGDTNKLPECAPCKKSPQCESTKCKNGKCVLEGDGKAESLEKCFVEECEPCSSNQDCITELCVKDKCLTGITLEAQRRCEKLDNCEECRRNSECKSGKCWGRKCIKVDLKSKIECGFLSDCEMCSSKNDCLSLKCRKGKCGNKRGVCEQKMKECEQCKRNIECETDLCFGGKCVKNSIASKLKCGFKEDCTACRNNNECLFLNCHDLICVPFGDKSLKACSPSSRVPSQTPSSSVSVTASNSASMSSEPPPTSSTSVSVPPSNSASMSSEPFPSPSSSTSISVSASPSPLTSVQCEACPQCQNAQAEVCPGSGDVCVTAPRCPNCFIPNGDCSGCIPDPTLDDTCNPCESITASDGTTFDGNKFCEDVGGLPNQFKCCPPTSNCKNTVISSRTGLLAASREVSLICSSNCGRCDTGNAETCSLFQPLVLSNDGDGNTDDVFEACPNTDDTNF